MKSEMKKGILTGMLDSGIIDKEKYRQWLDDEDIPEDDTPESRLFKECLEKLLQTDAWDVPALLWKSLRKTCWSVIKTSPNNPVRRGQDVFSYMTRLLSYRDQKHMDSFSVPV